MGESDCGRSETAKKPVCAKPIARENLMRGWRIGARSALFPKRAILRRTDIA
jgi:hypothetical protein